MIVITTINNYLYNDTWIYLVKIIHAL